MMTASSESDESRGTEIVVIAWVFTGIAIAIVALRFFVKARISKELGWDDFFILLSIVCNSHSRALRKDRLESLILMVLEQVTGTAASIFASYPVRLGLGRHTASVLADPGGQAKVVLAAKIQMIGYRMCILPGYRQNILNMLTVLQHSIFVSRY